MREPEPLLSVVIPTRDRAAMLERAVNGALREGAEVVVVDDGSTDGTGALLRRLEGLGVQHLRLETSRGPCYARNVGVELATSELVLFLDDDDVIVRGGGHAIRRLAAERPDFDLYLHNCILPDGRPSIPVTSEPTLYDYDDWLAGRLDAELKPVIRRKLFERDCFDDTGASGEGLLWGRVIRTSPCLVGGQPVVGYGQAAGTTRLTSALGQLRRRDENARIADLWLSEFGADVQARHPHRWANRALVSSALHLICGRRAEAWARYRAIPRSLLPRNQRLAFQVAARLPSPLVRLLFLLLRRELIVTLRSDGGPRAIFGADK